MSEVTTACRLAGTPVLSSHIPESPAEGDWLLAAVRCRDTDEFLVMRQPGLKLPALLEQAMANRPASAAVAFHRFAYRSGCHRRLASDPVFPDSAADSAADSGSDAKAATSVAPWHAVYDAREKHTESARSVRL